MTDPFGASIDYGYDDDGSLKNASQGATSYASGARYRAWGGLKKLDFGNGLQLNLTYTSRLQVRTFDLNQGSSLKMSKRYYYDADGRVNFARDQTISNSSLDRSFAYDHIGRLAYEIVTWNPSLLSAICAKTAGDYSLFWARRGRYYSGQKEDI